MATTGKCKSNYPFSLPDYLPVFDQGEFCQKELEPESLSWRSEKYADEGDTNVTVFEFDKGKGNRFQWNEERLKDNLNLQHQPRLRIVLLQPTVQEQLAKRLLRQNSEARDLLLKNRLAVTDEKRSSEESTAPVTAQKKLGPSQLNISYCALMNLLEHYRIAPAACSHVRGQEQVYGSRLTRDKAGKPESWEMWYAMRARAFVPEETKEADLKVTIITRSFNDLANGLKQDILQTIDEFIHHPSTVRVAFDPFIVGILHFFPIIQYYRRAARGPRDMIRVEEEKVHYLEKSKDIDIRRLHKTMASLDQDVVQLTFILDLIKRLRAEHEVFWTHMRRVDHASTVEAPVSVLEEALIETVSRELDRYQNYVAYFKESIREVRSKSKRLMDLTFRLNAKREAESQHQIAMTQQRLTELAVQESEAMAMIARITMLFLPGTFVTGILGCNLFTGPDNQRTDGKLVVSSQVWILPVAIILMTLLVFPLFLKYRHVRLLPSRQPWTSNDTA